MMDRTDIKIINYLLDSGRATIKEIGSDVNLSSPAVTERIKRLEEEGIIEGYHADVNYSKIGKNIQAFIMINVEPTRYNSFCSFCRDSPLILSHFHIIGPYNAMLHVAVLDSNELSTLLGKIQSYGTSQTSVILDTQFYRKSTIEQI